MIQKKRGLLYLSLVPHFKASRIAHLTKNEQRRSPRRICVYPLHRHHSNNIIRCGIGNMITYSQWASTVALQFGKI